MDSKSPNVTVSLTRCDDISFNKKVNSKNAVKEHKTIEVKRSLRLSEKRTNQDELVRNNNESDKKKKKMKKRKCNETKPKEPTSNKKSNNEGSSISKLTKVNLTNSDSHESSNVLHSSSTTGNNETLPKIITANKLKNKISVKFSSIKNVSEACNVDKNYTSDTSEDNNEYYRKRGRPSTLKTKEVSICNNKIDKQKTKNLAIIIEKQRNICKLEPPEVLDDNTMLLESKNKSSKVKKKWSEANLSENVKSIKPCSKEAVVNPSEIVSAITSKDLSISKVIVVDDPRTHLRTFEHQISLLSKRFNISLQTLRNIVVKEPLSVFREKYSKSTTPSMITVSPIVRMINEIASKEDGNYEKGNSNIIYKVEPIRFCEVYEKINLKDCMNELSNTMPSWSYSIVPNPSRFVIYQMSINTYGIPAVNKSIVLDRYFRASVYVNQCLQFKYCKRYHTATEIINLIKELNDI